MRKLVALAAPVLAALAFTISAVAGAFPDGPNGPQIVVENVSKGVSDKTLEKDLPIFQLYLNQVCEAWHCSGHLYLADTSQPHDWIMTVNDVSDVDGAIGYHTEEGGTAEGFVSVKTARQSGLPWTVVFTHELAEMLVDPEAEATENTWDYCDPFSGLCSNGTFYMKEIADPVQGESYKLGSVKVSDWVYRNWFEPGAPGPYDAGRHLGAPLTLAPESYLSIYKDNTWGYEDTFDSRDGFHQWDRFLRPISG